MGKVKHSRSLVLCTDVQFDHSDSCSIPHSLMDEVSQSPHLTGGSRGRLSKLLIFFSFFLANLLRGKGWGNTQEPGEDIDAHSFCKLQIEDTEIFNEDKTICSELLCAGPKRIEDRLSTTLSCRVITLQSQFCKLSSSRDRTSSFSWRQSLPTERIGQFICLKVSSFGLPDVQVLVLFVHDIIEVRIFHKTAHIRAYAFGANVE
jgi:hypothetical protein